MAINMTSRMIIAIPIPPKNRMLLSNDGESPEPTRLGRDVGDIEASPELSSVDAGVSVAESDCIVVVPLKVAIGVWTTNSSLASSIAVEGLI